MLGLLRKKTEKDFFHSFMQQYSHTDPIQKHFRQAFSSLHVFCVCLCVGVECMCVLTALSLPFSNYPPTL